MTLTALQRSGETKVTKRTGNKTPVLLKFHQYFHHECSTRCELVLWLFTLSQRNGTMKSTNRTLHASSCTTARSALGG